MKTTKETRAGLRRFLDNARPTVADGCPCSPTLRCGMHSAFREALADLAVQHLPDLLDDLEALEQERDRDGILADLAFTHTARSAALKRERDQLAEKLRVAVEALREYADDDNWVEVGLPVGWGWSGPMIDDEGPEPALAALARIEGDGDE